MTRESASRKRDKLAATLTRSADILRGSLLERTTFTAPAVPNARAARVTRNGFSM